MYKHTFEHTENLPDGSSIKTYIQTKWGSISNHVPPRDSDIVLIESKKTIIDPLTFNRRRNTNKFKEKK